MARPTCMACVLKHLGQATVLIQEARKSYPHHMVYAIGHLAEAEDEAPVDLANQIRDIRVNQKWGDLNLLIFELYNGSAGDALKNQLVDNFKAPKNWLDAEGKTLYDQVGTERKDKQ